MTVLPYGPLILALALAIDRIVGDPNWLWTRAPHPIVLIGRAIDRLDKRVNRVGLDFGEARRAGILLIGMVVAGAGLTGLALHLAFASLPLGAALEAIVVAAFLAQKSLIDHVARVADRLAAEGLRGGRSAVAEIVGRDVSVLDEPGISRAAIESLAENFSDGVVAPAFWYLLLGLPGLLIYKAANTADSMIGHRSPRYLAFGWAAARLDDLLNIVPARLSALLMVVTSALTGSNPRTVLSTTVRDAPKHKSPNAGWPETALAAALGIALGGPRRYGVEEVAGAWLNPHGRIEVTPEDIRTAIRVTDTAWALLVVLIAFVAVIALWIAQ